MPVEYRACQAFWLLLALQLTFCVSAQAMDLADDNASMQVHLVRYQDPSCEPNCPEWIAAQGMIDGSSLGRFKRALSVAGKRTPLILLHSPGGSVRDAMAIGRLIRSKGLNVAVTRTHILDCKRNKDPRCRKVAKGVQLGSPDAYGSRCLSACPFLLAGGAARMVGAGASVGVHSLWRVAVEERRRYRSGRRLMRQIELRPETVPTRAAVYRDLRRYLAEMGVADHLVTLVQGTPKEDVHVLSHEALFDLRVATIALSGQQFLTPGRSHPKDNGLQCVRDPQTGECRPGDSSDSFFSHQGAPAAWQQGDVTFQPGISFDVPAQAIPSATPVEPAVR